MKIAFDVDGTLIHKDQETGIDIPNYRVIDFLTHFDWIHHTEIFVWSGGGIDYAQHWVDKLGLQDTVKVVAKGSFIPDIAVDDEEVELGKVNLRV